METLYNRSLYFYFFLLPVLIFPGSGCKGPENKNLQKEIDSIALSHVPDSRVGICNVKALPSEGGVIILSGETTDPSVRDDITNALDKNGIKFIDSILVIPDTIINRHYTGLVTMSVINLRKEPLQSAELTSQARLGTPVIILIDNNSWLLVQTPDKYIAWTESSSITPMTAHEMKLWKDSGRVIFLENTGWIFTSPDEKGVTSDIVAGCILQKVGETGGYARVILPDGREGYINAKSVMDFKTWVKSAGGNPMDICNRASSMLGIPYLWGGTSPKAADCSGFTQTVFLMNGYILQRDASLQALHGQTVDLSDNFSHLMPGDLLFFGPMRNGIPHVTHVAIYKGNMEYIHSSGMVRINSLDSTQSNFSGSRLKMLLLAKRIIGTVNDEGIVAIKDHSWY
jgi:gamma-D-glutamyl-L-lysine dipeptidyl-peptidase